MKPFRQINDHENFEPKTSSFWKGISAPSTWWRRPRWWSWSCGETERKTAVLRGADGSVLVRPIQLVIALEFDQGGGGSEGSLELSIYLNVREFSVLVSNKGRCRSVYCVLFVLDISPTGLLSQRCLPVCWIFIHVIKVSSSHVTFVPLREREQSEETICTFGRGVKNKCLHENISVLSADFWFCVLCLRDVRSTVLLCWGYRFWSCVCS